MTRAYGFTAFLTSTSRRQFLAHTACYSPISNCAVMAVDAQSLIFNIVVRCATVIVAAYTHSLRKLVASIALWAWRLTSWSSPDGQLQHEWR